MRVLLVTDIHGEVDKLSKIVEKEDFEAVLCAGDISDAREFENYEAQLGKVLEVFEREKKLVKAVPGNMDPEEICVKALMDRRMNIHKRIASFEEFEAVGFGGGITPFGTPFEPEEGEIENTLRTLYERMSAEKKVGVIHQPPKDTELDIAEGEHVGSQAVRDLIEETGFDLILTGHIHESRGKDELDETIIVNPGPVLEGYYGIAEIGEEVSVELKQI